MLKATFKPQESQLQLKYLLANKWQIPLFVSGQLLRCEVPEKRPGPIIFDEMSKLLSQ